MEARLGVLGCGQMGGALLAGWLEAGVVDAAGVRVFDPHATPVGVSHVDTAQAVLDACDVVLLAVKPQFVEAATEGLRFRADHVVISVAAGVSRVSLLGRCAPAEVVRVMPNVAARVGAGATVVLGGATRPEAVARAVALFAAVGHAEILDDERLFHVGTALVGSAPAWLFMAIEALADGAVAAGMPRRQALRLAVEVVRGAGALAADGTHPAALKDSVCSPGGTTIAGLRAAENGGLRSALIEAVLAATERSVQMEGS